MTEPVATIAYRGENGEGWVPPSHRALWDYAVRTGQVVLPPVDDGGPANLPDPVNSGDLIGLVWVPPEYAGRLTQAPPPPQPTYFEINDEETTDDDE